MQKNQEKQKKSKKNYQKYQEKQEISCYPRYQIQQSFNDGNNNSIGQNYTFAQLNKSQKRILSFNGQLLSQNLSKKKNKHLSSFSAFDNPNCSCSEILEQDHFQSQKSSSSQMQSEKNENNNYFEQMLNRQRKKWNQTKEQMILKIQQQTSKVYKLEQKLYYYQGLCKRLLKQQEKQKEIYKRSTQKIIEESSKLRKAQLKIAKLQEKIKILMQKQKQNLFVGRLQSIKPLNQKIPSQDCKKLNCIENQRKNQNEEKIKQRQELIEMNNRVIVDLRAKNLNLSKINELLQSQIKQSNIKIIELQKQVQNFTHKQYQSYIKRIKSNLNSSLS